MSVVGLGTNNFGRRATFDATVEVVQRALDEGITLIDSADTYGDSEEYIGRILGARRGEIVLATKFGMPNGRVAPAHVARGSRRYIRMAVESSLTRLRTDWIDLYQLHEPDPRTPIEETLAALDELVTSGKVRYIGSSNFAGWQIVDADWVARRAVSERFVSAQNQYNLIDRGVEADVVPAALRCGVGILPYHPLSNGLLTGKYRRGQVPASGRLADPARADQLTDARFDVVERLDQYAAARDVTLLDVAIGGLAAQPAVASVIAGAMTADQVSANVAAGQWIPGQADLDELNAIRLR